MMVARLVILSIIVVASGNSMTGTFQVCNLQCSNVGQASPPVSDNIFPTNTLLRGKLGPRGEKGEVGPLGAQGRRGEKGRGGRQGVQGSHGEVGSQGVKGEAGINLTLIEQLQNRINQLERESDLIKKVRPRNCTQIKEQYPEATTGIYRIYENIFDGGKEVRCDMTSEGRTGHRNCKEILDIYPSSADGVYTIQINTTTWIDVLCDMEGGGWTVFQKRFDGSENFNRTFNEYSVGFGNLNHEHWLGLNNIHQLTLQPGNWTLEVDIETFDNETAYARYTDFSIGGGTDYILYIGSYNGTAGDSLSYSRGRKFSTPDRDQDGASRGVYSNCAKYYTGAWWYKMCLRSNLNAFNYGNVGDSPNHVSWKKFNKSYLSLKSSQMKAMVRDP